MKYSRSVRSRRAMISASVVALVMAVSLPGAAQSAPLTAAKSFSIPAGSLENGLLMFADQAGVQLVVDARNVQGLSASPLSGKLPPREALDKIIGDAPVRVQWTSPMTVLVKAVAPRARTIAMQSSPRPVASSQPARLESVTNDDIIVTARKRDETSISVPVVIAAVGAAELQRRGISNFDSLARTVSQLTIGEGGGTIQGGTIALRGISGPDTNPFGDQAVSFNIDGLQVAKASVRRLGNFDVEQVEVLKGPQALFFGKNSPGGVISIRTADPTPSLEAKLSLGYEFNARERMAEGYISGPLTETLGARIAFYGSDMDGWVKNTAPRDTPFSARDRLPKTKQYGVRGTLLFRPTEDFSARLKVTVGRATGSASGANFQLVDCPYGAPQTGATDDCKANNHISKTDPGPNFTQYEPMFKDGHSYSRANQQLASLELNYNLSDELLLTSVTGFYHMKFTNVENYTPGLPTIALPFLGLPFVVSYNPYSNREITEEMRLTTDFSGPINLTVGGLYQTTRATSGNHVFTNPFTPIEFADNDFRQKGTAYSLFGQVRWDVLPTLEVSAGGRYSHEEKKLWVNSDITGDPSVSTRVPLVLNTNKVSFNDFSPEVTVSYRPTSDLTLFGSYKRGFLSGGFNSSSADTSLPLNYGPQKIRGFEGGLKAALFDRRLRINLAAYSYKVPGLQVTAYEGTVGTIRNAGKVSVKGAEFDFNYRASNNLTFRGAVAYNRGRYDEYFAPCYSGQTIALGCDLVMNGSVVQDLAGTQIRNAPKWTGSLGFNYETEIGSGLQLGLSSDVNFSSSEITDAKSIRQLRSPKRGLVDASLRVFDTADTYEIALIGRNLTNRHYWVNGQEVALTGSPAGGTTGTLSDYYAYISRGRELMIRLSYKFGGSR